MPKPFVAGDAARYLRVRFLAHLARERPVHRLPAVAYPDASDRRDPPRRDVDAGDAPALDHEGEIRQVMAASSMTAFSLAESGRGTSV
ncbi:MAG TPA: hypothetical protein VFR85_14290 [Anaeromyxobacteraceae bacterium]|nr:hypothetical protein [Anaeromyxobacteraceae bacterium]